MKILLMSRSLELGGTERQIVELAKGLRRLGKDVRVAVFYGGGGLEHELEAARIPVVDLGKRGRYDVIGPFRRLRRIARTWRPRVLYSFLVEPNILSVLAIPRRSDIRVVWGVRAGAFDRSDAGRFPRWTFRLATLLSNRASLIIFNSASGRSYHEQLGFPSERGVVVPNGIDTERFVPGGGAALRSSWRLKPDEVAVGMVARLDPLKGHTVFLEAAARVADSAPDFRFVLVGPEPGEGRSSLERHQTALGLGDRVIWAGMVPDVAAVYPALDLLCLPSLSEGLPNVALEAMSCGVPAVVTDVGDAAIAVEGIGTVCAPGDPVALANAIMALRDRHRREPDLGERARKRVEERFGLERMVSETAQLLSRGDVMKGQNTSSARP